MSIHLQSGNLFYDNFNTQENCYDFLLNQQDKKKVIIKKKTAYYKTFKRYYFHYEKIDKFDLFSDKNAKYLFCKSNAYLEGTHQPKKSGRHTIKVNGKFSLGKLQEVSWQYVLTQIIKVAHKPKNEVVNDVQNLYIFENILSNYRV